MRAVSFTVEQGDFFGLLGPNGAGKSTLIGALGGYVRPDSGQMSILGYNSKEDWRNFKMGIGIVPQETTFDPHFTVWETLRFQSGYYGLRDNEKWIDELLERFEIADKKYSPVFSLSGGMKRRILIIQALVHRAPVLVLDEPTAGVDIELRHRLWDFMKELNRKGHTIILTTHYLEEAEQLCHNVALLNHGKLIALENTKALLRRFSGERIKFSLPNGKSLPEDFPFKCTPIESSVYSMEVQSPDTLRNLLNSLDRAGLTPDGVELGHSSLEDVFLYLTSQNE
ncbi:MAG: ABC transporter ATP-binding protein [Burkholderiales bacterium]|nr:ABC transporter ATP-binding protein [Burkholderiales bacterium]